MRKISLLIGLMAIFSVAVASPLFAYDYSEAENCAACHIPPGAHMAYVVDRWYESAHAQSYMSYLGNTYCATCHSPFQADPSATHSANEAIPEEQWEAVTCAVCHPPHDLRVEWGTPIALYDVASDSYSPVALEDANMLCEQCHTGERHSREFQGFGNTMMHKKGVRCIDCHMAKVPLPVEGLPDRASHDFAVAPNLPYSCGTIVGGCHSNKKVEWAEKQINKGRIHGE